MNADDLFAALDDSERAELLDAQKSENASLANKTIRAILERAERRVGAGREALDQLFRRFVVAKPAQTAPAGSSPMSLSELARLLPYPLGWKLASLLRDKQLLEEGQSAPQLVFDVVSLTSALLRFVSVVLVHAYVRAGGSDAKVNRKIVETLTGDPTDASWRDLARALAKALGGAPPTVTEGFAAALDGVDVPAEQRAPNVKDDGGNNKDLWYLIALRNAVAHGHRVAPQYVEAAVDVLADLLRRFSALTRFRLVVRTGEGGYALEGDRPVPLATLDSALPEGEPCLVSRDGSGEPVSLSPLLRFRPGTDDVTFDELFFLNAGSLDRLNYIAFRSPDTLDGRALGSYESFRELMKKIPTPPIPANPRLDFGALVAESTRFFVGREGVVETIQRMVREREAAFCLLRALPGMGKTSLLSHLHALHPPPIAGQPQAGDRWCYHFCSNTDGRNSPVVMLRSLIAQVADAVGMSDAQRGRYASSTDLKELRDGLFPALLAEAGKQLGDGDRLVIVVDALDEGFGGEEPIAAALPAVLPPNVVALLSYRVDETGRNARVEETLRHISSELRREVPGADPLRGLTRDNVREFLAQVRREHADSDAPLTEFTPSEPVLEAVYRASLTKEGDADPFYLRFVAQGAEAGTIDLDRAESVPQSLDDTFEELWLSLPTDGDFVVHRLLLYLAILREPATDPLMAELLTRERPALARVTTSDVATMRVHAGKLLVYDERERYALFHDRFKRFLVGEQKDPLEVELGGLG